MAILMAATIIAERGKAGASVAPTPTRGTVGRRVEQAGQERNTALHVSRGDCPSGHEVVEDGRPTPTEARRLCRTLAHGEPRSVARAASSLADLDIVGSFSMRGVRMGSVAPLPRAVQDIHGADDMA